MGFLHSVKLYSENQSTQQACGLHTTEEDARCLHGFLTAIGVVLCSFPANLSFIRVLVYILM